MQPALRAAGRARDREQEVADDEPPDPGPRPSGVAGHQIERRDASSRAHEDEREALAHGGRPSRRPDTVAQPAPESRPEQTPSVQRKRRKQIEQREGQVEKREIPPETSLLGHPHQPTGVRVKRPGDGREDGRDQKARQRPRDGDAELVRGSLCLAPYLRYSAEDEQRDPPRIDAVRPRDDRVRQLVQEDEHVEQERDRDREQRRPAALRLADDGGHELGAHDQNQNGEDEEPAGMHGDLDGPQPEEHESSSDGPSRRHKGVIVR